VPTSDFHLRLDVHLRQSFLMPSEAMDVDGTDGEGQAAAADVERPTKVVTENIDLLLRAKVIVANCRPVRASAP